MKLWALVSVVLFASVNAFSQPCLNAAKEVPPKMSAATRGEYQKKLEEAEQVHLEKPNDADSIIWLGRRTAYLGEYKKAVWIFSSGITLHKNDARFYRHRGHRYLTLRCFDDAIKDFEKAAELVKGKPDEIEPDGLPNAKNIPTSTLQSNIWYHLGLAYYLKRDFPKAIKAYEEAQKVSTNNDMKVATTYWHYMTLRREGKKSEAKKLIGKFDTKIEVIENDDYLKLLRLNKGELRADDLVKTLEGETNSLGSASLGYGIGNYYFYNGKKKQASEVFRKITLGDQWASFGYIAAQVEGPPILNPSH